MEMKKWNWDMVIVQFVWRITLKEIVAEYFPSVNICFIQIVLMIGWRRTWHAQFVVDTFLAHKCRFTFKFLNENKGILLHSIYIF